MLVEFECPHCKTSLCEYEELAGQERICPNCKKAITVPTQDSKGKGNKTAKGK